MGKFRIFVLLIATFVFTSTSYGQSNGLESSLLNTRWQGKFRTVLGDGRIQIQFLGYLDAKGAVPYYHEVRKDSPFTDSLSLVDGACDFTPRYLSVNPPSQPKISVYECEANANVEAQLSQDVSRKAKTEIQVVELSLSADGKSLRIKAEILGTTVEYDLKPVLE